MPFRSLPEAVAERLLDFRDSVVGALGPDLVGLYLLGSVAFPGFEPKAADIDFHAVIGKELDERQKDELAGVHARLASAHRFGGLVDGYYIPVAKARRPEIPEGLVGAGEGLLNRAGTARNVAWALEREHAHRGKFVALHGRHPATIYPRPTWPELEAALRAELESLPTELPQAPVYAVLNLCRLAYSFETRRVAVSKVEAAAWVLREFPERWRPLVEAALRGYRGAAHDADHTLMLGEGRRFFADVERRLRR